MPSPFAQVPSSEWTASNELAFAIRDRFPVSPGHTLVITRREVADWFEATGDERAAILSLVDEVKASLDRELRPDGYNVGFNAGVAAGQTVMHLHVHVIPRYRGDMEDPRGGVRHAIPGKGNYLATMERRPLVVGGTADPFSRQVLPLFQTAIEVAIVAAFTQESGLRRIREAVHGAIRRGATVRILTGDYLDITQASALEVLHDWQQASGVEEDAEDDERGAAGRFEARVIEVERLPAISRSFHPKSWRFEGSDYGVAFVGSSNLSRSALDSGIEWNLRVDRDRDALAYGRVREAFEAIWTAARGLDLEWIAEYAKRARRLDLAAVRAGDDATDPVEPLPPPHAVQQQALARLRASRETGATRALVVLATGLGKTLLAALDFEQVCAESGKRSPRVLFIAHRRELLRQAADTYRRLRRSQGSSARVGWFVGTASELSADLVFASVGKLARRENLARLKNEPFDYVVIDEVHHAAADSYRRILAAVEPGFLLGLTATPDRADEADILGLFDDNVVFRAGIPQGITIGRLVPFHYFGVKDSIDYSNIPWRNHRFDPAALVSAAQTEARMSTLWTAWGEHPGSRTLVFCCSVAHAQYVRDWLRQRGVRAEAVFTGVDSDDRDGAIRKLEAGELDAVCSVDVFNEGIDVPLVDRVVMLRPTESGVVFLQQLGRGLRVAAGKTSVTVIDFVGNHRVFLGRLRTLLSLGEETAVSVRSVLMSTGATALPEGCSVELALEAKEVLSRLFRQGGTDEVERMYRELRDSRETRPTPGELLHLGANPGQVGARHGSWYAFVAAEGDLDPDERAVFQALGAFLQEVEVTGMTKSFKMVTLQALLEADALPGGLLLSDLAARSRAILCRSPELAEDVPPEFRGADLDAPASSRWLAYWRKNPIAAWTGSRREGKSWFRLDEDRFYPALEVNAAHATTFAHMVQELVDYRLAQYRRRWRLGAVSDEGLLCRVLWNKRDPILKLPAARREALPSGDREVRVDGAVWTFSFAKEFCNVARPIGTPRNQLPDLLRSWFGPTAGHPGTTFEVRFVASPDGLWAEPVQTNVVELTARRAIPAYPDLRAAAGHGTDLASLPQRPVEVLLPLENLTPDLFAVRVCGTSMDGGRAPLRDGDWAVMRLARGAAPAAVRDRAVLVQSAGHGDSVQLQIKRLVARDGGWQLASDNPDGPSFAATDEMNVVARLERSFAPEALAPSVGSVLRESHLAESFGLPELPARTGRSGGHLFVFVDRKGMLTAIDRVHTPDVAPDPGETAYVLASAGNGEYRYLGVGRWLEDDRCWSLTGCDFATWRTWGDGRSASRPLPEGVLSRARQAADALLALDGDDRWITQPRGRRGRLLGAAAQGGLRIDGGDGGFQERTVSLTDLAWVIVAADDVRATGGLLDEARVNRLRYLEGTPKASTRWIDTGWALGAWAKVADRLKAP